MTDPAARRAGRADRNLPAAAPGDFQPQNYLEMRDNLPHLPLKWRLAWLRSEQPQARLSTELVSHQEGVAIFKALVELPGGASATGWGAQSHPDKATDGPFDYITAAENQALLRALSALGYGIEYAYDFDPPADYLPIALPSRPAYDNDAAPAIEVPPSLSLPAAEDEDDDDGEPDQEPEPARPETRTLRENRPPLDSRPARPAPAERPAPAPAEAPAQSAAPANLTSPVVEERLKNVRDEALRLVIKQIYTEARARFNIDEDRVDQRSRSRFTRPANELDQNEAEQFLEAILSAVKRRN